MSSSYCIFCRIVKKELLSYAVYEDDAVMAFLDAYPLARGHVLVVPKVHATKLEELDEELAERVLMVTYRLVGRVCSAVKAQASTIAINNGMESGQEIAHLHIHMIPRFRGDQGGPIHDLMRSRPHVSKEEMTEIAREIRES